MFPFSPASPTPPPSTSPTSPAAAASVVPRLAPRSPAAIPPRARGFKCARHSLVDLVPGGQNIRVDGCEGHPAGHRVPGLDRGVQLVKVHLPGLGLRLGRQHVAEGPGLAGVVQQVLPGRQLAQPREQRVDVGQLLGGVAARGAALGGQLRQVPLLHHGDLAVRRHPHPRQHAARPHQRRNPLSRQLSCNN